MHRWCPRRRRAPSTLSLPGILLPPAPGTTSSSSTFGRSLSFTKPVSPVGGKSRDRAHRRHGSGCFNLLKLALRSLSLVHAHPRSPKLKAFTANSDSSASSGVIAALGALIMLSRSAMTQACSWRCISIRRTLYSTYFNSSLRGHSLFAAGSSTKLELKENKIVAIKGRQYPRAVVELGLQLLRKRRMSSSRRVGRRIMGGMVPEKVGGDFGEER
jgi:hypothetical protein